MIARRTHSVDIDDPEADDGPGTSIAVALACGLGALVVIGIVAICAILSNAQVTP